MATYVLITGSTRGIGKALATAFLARPEHVVIAACRDVHTEDALNLKNIPTGQGSRLITIQIDSTRDSDPSEAVETLQNEFQIRKLDIVIANAGISRYFGSTRVTPVHEMMDHYKINVVGPLLLFQATAPLLDHSKAPKFVSISSGAGSIAGIEKLKMENTAYGASKAGLNFVTRRIHAENENIIAFPVHPGWLRTALGDQAAAVAGLAEAPVELETGVRGILNIIDNATREETSGRFMAALGGELSW